MNGIWQGGRFVLASTLEEQIDRLEAQNRDLLDTVKACLVAAGGSERDDDLERQCNATGDKPSIFIGSRVNRLRNALDELTAIVRGECPSLLNGDSGGNDRLAIEIDELLEQQDKAGDVHNGQVSLLAEPLPAESVISRMFERGSSYSCNGSPRGCEGERFHGCIHCESLGKCFV